MHTQPLAVRPHAFQGAFGLACRDITPPVGIYSRNWGAAQHDVATSIHRPLTLTALVITSTAETAPPCVLVDVDLGWWKTPETFRKFQSRLLDELQLLPEQLLFALSHTHAGPPLMDADLSLPGSDLLQVWMEELYSHTVSAVQEASAQRFTGTLEWRAGHCDLAAVRDLPDPDASRQRIICGFNPLLQPDNTLLVGRLSDASGRVRATLVNYACHPTTLAWDNTAISPDYVGAMRETLRAATGAPALFLLGACGDLAPRYQYVGDTAVADRHGRQLGHAALAVLNNMEAPGTALVYHSTVESGAPLAVWQPEAVVPVGQLPAEQLPAEQLCAERCTVELKIKAWPTADELERERQACTDRALEERLRRKRDIRRGLGDKATFPLPIYVWRLGDAVLVGSCCEPYSQLQVDLRERFPEHTLICMNLVNGSIGYLPPADLYDTEVYPVWQTPFDRGSLEATLETMTEAIRHVLSR